MVRTEEEFLSSGQDGGLTLSFPQNSWVVPQKPYLLQHTFSGHLDCEAHSMPQPGSHSDFALQLEVQLPLPQKVGPRPHTPVFEQHPTEQGLVALQL